MWKKKSSITCDCAQFVPRRWLEIGLRLYWSHSVKYYFLTTLENDPPCYVHNLRDFLRESRTEKDLSFLITEFKSMTSAMPQCSAIANWTKKHISLWIRFSLESKAQAKILCIAWRTGRCKGSLALGVFSLYFNPKFNSAWNLRNSFTIS